jgi:Domain of unknown function (DUF5658)
MNLAIPCARCGRMFTVAEQLGGRKIRCQSCGQVQRIPIFPTTPIDKQTATYPLAPELPKATSTSTPQLGDLAQQSSLATSRQSRRTRWHRTLHATIGEASLLEIENLALITLSVADVLVTYALLRRGPEFYESNPVAQWFFLRWNIAGMAVLKFGAMGLVIVIGEIVERHRPGWGRVLLLVSCLATAAVVWFGLRLLFGHADNGVPLA